MSGQCPPAAHKVRRNVSPSASQRQGPMKAVKPFGILNSRSPSSPSFSLLHRRSPVSECRHSPDRRSPNSPCFKVERPKAVRVSPASSSLRRTGSLDTIGPYLKGQWPVDIGGCHHTQQSGTFMLDKTTQTPDDWQVEVIINKEKKKKKHRRSASFGHADKKLGLNSIRQKLQKTKDQGSKQRSSPIPGNHNALLQTAPAILMRSVAIPIINSHIPKTSMSRFQRNSVEGLNPGKIQPLKSHKHTVTCRGLGPPTHSTPTPWSAAMWKRGFIVNGVSTIEFAATLQEIEKLVALTISGTDDEIERSVDIPDGHRAPVPEMRHSSGTRSIDTQTPSGILDRRSSSISPASPASRPHSISPATIPIIPGLMDNSPRPSINYDSSGSTPRDKSDKETGDSDSISPDGLKKMANSPKPNTIVREPPDGCEKVNFDEDKTGKIQPLIKEPLYCPIQGQGQFVLKPSLSSAFCPLQKYYTTQGNTSFKQQTSPITTTTIIEGQ